MKTITLVTTRFPWPLTNGFANKNFWLIRGLSLRFRVRLHVVEYRQITDGDLKAVENYCQSVQIYRPSIFDITVGLLKSIYNDEPFQLALFHSYAAKRKINESLKSSEYGFASVVRAVPYLEKFSGPKFCDLADSLSQIYLRDAPKYGLIKRLVYTDEARRLKKYESMVVKRFQAVFLFNQNEAVQYNSSKIIVVPHGVDPRLFSEDQIDKRCNDGVVLFGRMSYEPNIDALSWFVKMVLPRLPKHIKIYVIGAEPSPRVKKIAFDQPRVVITGYIDNPYPIMRGAIACVCPIQIGGGIQNKVVEALAIGAITLVSPLAVQGMGDYSTSGMIVCRKPDDWAKEIINIQGDPKIFENNRAEGREYAKQRFSWEKYNKIIEEQINRSSLDLVGRGGGRVADGGHR